jgi:hypothetical protein
VEQLLTTVVGVIFIIEKLTMTHPHHPVRVHLSHRHCGAVCKEMGERLSSALGTQFNELPPALLALMGRLARGENSDFVRLDA